MTVWNPPGRKPRREGLPHFMYRVIFADDTEGWYWPDTKAAYRLFRDSDIRDYEISVVWWPTYSR